MSDQFRDEPSEEELNAELDPDLDRRAGSASDVQASGNGPASPPDGVDLELPPTALQRAYDRFWHAFLAEHDKDEDAPEFEDVAAAAFRAGIDFALDELAGRTENAMRSISEHLQDDARDLEP